MHRSTLGTLLAASLACASLLSASIVSAASFSGARLPIDYRSWTFTRGDGTKQTITQLSVPTILSLRLREGSDLVISTEGAWSGETVAATGTRTALDGRGDARFQLLQELGSSLLFVGGVSVPSGKTGLNRAQLDVARGIGHPLLGFHTRQYGRGFDVTVGLASSLALRGAWSMGLGAGLVRHGAYALEAERAEFAPAPETNASIGIEFDPPEFSPARFRLYSTLRQFGVDRLGGRRNYEEGDQLDLDGEGTLRLGRLRLHGDASLTIKGEESVYASIDSLGRRSQPSGSGLRVGFALERDWMRALSGGLAMEASSFAGSARAGEDGHVLGLGPVAQVRLGSTTNLSLRLLAHSGRTDGGTRDGAGSSLRGYSTSLTLVWRGETD